MEKVIEKNTELISACGLYCGACNAYKKGKCPGCAEKTNAAWCKIRLCCKESGIDNCAECEKFESAKECKYFNNAISNLFAFVFRSDRVANLELIKNKGGEFFVDYMSEHRLVSLKKGKAPDL
jgi:hypothetical protein